MTSKLPGFYRLSLPERHALLSEVADLTPADADVLAGEDGLCPETADRMVENALGVMGMPLGLCANLRINGRDRLVPMAVEEPSVVAAASHAAKMLRDGEGLRCEVTGAQMVGQLQLLDVPDVQAAREALRAATPELLALADSRHARLVAAGGGARGLEVRELPARPGDPCGDMLVVHLIVDVQDAMGANAINSMCERLAPRVEALTGGRVRLRILSNLTDRRRVRVTGRVPVGRLAKHGMSGAEVARGIEEASVFAERDPYRAATHNKGIMNGIDAALIAFGQDWRAVEAGAHAWAARDGQYTALATWRVEADHLVGRLDVPLAVGTVGGIMGVHPTVAVARRIARVEDAADLAMLVAAVGLAQNLSALRALAAEGIQHGHMRLHARNVATAAGAEPHEVALVAERMAELGSVRTDTALELLVELRRPVAAAGGSR